MSETIMQFNSGEQIVGSKNVAQAVNTDGTIVFNESYIVIGDVLKGSTIHATYDLTVLGSISANKLVVNGDLLVQGDIEVGDLECHGQCVCLGKITAKTVSLGNISYLATIDSNEIFSSDSLFVGSTMDIREAVDINGMLVAGEGILGEGSFSSDSTIVNEYFEFSGEVQNKVYELSEMDFSVLSDIRIEDVDVEKLISALKDSFSMSVKKWGDLEEEELIQNVLNIAKQSPDFVLLTILLPIISELSYQKEIDNFRDYLYVLGAKNIFPDELSKYETIEPVLTTMFDAATMALERMVFRSNDLNEFSISLYILSAYHSQLPISLEEAGDKLFSSVGLRYSTVDHVWRKQNG